MKPLERDHIMIVLHLYLDFEIPNISNIKIDVNEEKERHEGTRVLLLILRLIIILDCFFL